MESEIENSKASSTPMMGLAEAMAKAPPLQSFEAEVADDGNAAVDESVSNETAKAATGNSEAVQQYVTRYRNLKKKDKETFIELCEVVNEARGTLSKEDFGTFCKSVNINPSPKSSMLRRMQQTGKVAARLAPHLASLPDHRWTIANLAALDADVFDRVIKDPRFGPEMTNKVLKEIVGKPTTQRGGSAGNDDEDDAADYDITFHTKEMSAERRSRLCSEAKSTANAFSCPLTIGSRVEAELNEATKKAA